ncbi:Matrix-remodeling-associated protein 8 [Platysternon megacephalum]|uniref:Matrix-remodeling-associated protein 8 n=1 Tax=Platysternon megacephalum TaxID=55544 RepID=A0A4D9DGF0_9SAUR|nr:Matrix-remodeling-associated protein 8 [Platysternon megacephalum]
MADPSEGAELTLTSGAGECETRVCDTDGEPQCPTGDVCLARLRARPQPLSMETLQGARDGLERRGELGEELSSCLGLALERFCREPQCVQENARLLIRWGGGELAFVSGQGQCEISVSRSAGEPQYHITGKTWDVFVAWTNSHPEPLSIKNLESVQNTLESWGLGGEELSGCFGEAISQFSQEPPCVQGNARLRLCWGGQSLEFLSGDGECEISVCYRDGRPQYDIGELPVHMYLDWLHAWPDPLSADTLWRVWDKLGSCKGDRDDLRACFHCVWEEFKREPQYVQDNARLLIQWGRRQLRFTSGKGECEISVRCVDGKPQYSVGKIPAHVYVAQLRADRPPLSADTLQRVLSELGSCDGDTGALRACFDRAWQGFRREPRCVQENARLLIRWDGGELEFIAGQGQCEICVSCSTGEPQYHITEKTWDVFVAWTNLHPEPLSIKNLESVRNTLGRWGALGEQLSGCFGEAISQFSREPPCVQGNARLRLCWAGGSLEFLSGEGQCEISVHCRDGRPQYDIGELPVHMYLDWLRAHPEPLSADTLQRVWDKLGSCQGDRDDLRACFDRAWQGFRQEPRCVQGNARLLIRWGGGELEFVSGQGQCEISVLLADGEPQYHITELGGDRPVTWSHASPEPLSVADLARVRDRLGRWGALGEELSGCFGEAISQFSREPPCVQGNARMRICWDGGSLEFLSGEGQYIFSVFYDEGNPRYYLRVETLPGHLYVTRLRSRKDPLTADNLFKFYSDLGLCGGDTAELRTRLYTAWERFGQEPQCVQENARLLIRWDGGKLDFVSGQGQCEICVSCSAGKPQYHITEKTWDVFVAWRKLHPEPLSIKNLESVRNTLESWGALELWGVLGKELSGCFGEAISQFRREPPCVQGNARRRLCWAGGSLEFVSGKGQYEISVSYQEGNPRYHFHVETLPVDLYVARLRSRKNPLTADNLFKYYTELGFCQGDTAVLRARLYTAWERFSQEPRCVQGNARLLIRWRKKKLKFISGQGQCEISVLLADGEPQYHITELGGDRPVTWSHASPEPLSVTDLVRVRDRLGRWGALGEELSGCFGEAISRFRQEPPCVQGNARLRLYWDRGSLEFLSGEGQCEISVRYRDGRPQYGIGELPVHMYLDRLHTRPEPLSIDTLRRVQDKLGSCKGDKGDLSTCFHCAWEGFSGEPQYVQDNARLLIQWGRRQLRADQQSLSADTWQRVLSELRSCCRDTGALRDCFDRAWQGICQEPRCVQENARLLIQWGGQEEAGVCLRAGGEFNHHV